MIIYVDFGNYIQTRYEIIEKIDNERGGTFMIYLYNQTFKNTNNNWSLDDRSNSTEPAIFINLLIRTNWLKMIGCIDGNALTMSTCYLAVCCVLCL